MLTYAGSTFDFDQENGNMAHANGDHETVKLTKDVSWEEEEEEVTEHYLKIYAKYITDGQVKCSFLCLTHVLVFHVL